MMEKFAGYGFNKSHSAAYALLAYQTAYLKAHYPVEFMAALLTSERGNTDKIVKYIDECREMGIARPAARRQRVGHGLHRRSGGEHPLSASASAIKNVGEGAVEAVLAARSSGAASRRSSISATRVDLRAVNRRVLESLVKSGCFDSLERAASALFAALDRAMEAGQRRQRDREHGQASLFGARCRPRRGARRRGACRTSPSGARANDSRSRRRRSASTSPVIRSSATATELAQLDHEHQRRAARRSPSRAR